MMGVEVGVGPPREPWVWGVGSVYVHLCVCVS